MQEQEYVLNDTEYQEIWDRFYAEFCFHPSCQYRGHSFNVPLPFEIRNPYMVYAIDTMTEEQIDRMYEAFHSCFMQLTEAGAAMYALDWHHVSYRYDPRKTDTVRYPSFYPDGDYYFFVEENFRFGLLGHPWRQEWWIFGSDLLQKMTPYANDISQNQIYP